MDGRVVWITGASSGLGKEIALQAAKQGDTVVLLARRIDKLLKIEKEIQNAGGNAHSFQLDVGDLDNLEIAINSIMSKVGRIDVLINNAGFGVFEHLTDVELDVMKEMFHVNVLGLIAFTRYVVPYMIEQKGGHIINIASQAGKLATPKASIYAATKHAVLGFTNSLRMELSPNQIHVSAVNPGPIQTDFFTRADEAGSYVKSVEKWMLQSKDVAEKVIRLIKKPKREVNLPRWMGAGSTIYQLFPTLIEKLAGKKLSQK
ncbi:SDR family oxidoreductase [Halalkalibacter sp. APA_J-10(15)]|uniref:SDR family NAD(P)-dependent oxidoreductase n=1 Tax=Halalkalibacter sp. APA_J-10(15) TaxID=2933805 RepID=UPI001FF0F797|nr:SDR family oxidoreductase [Halalkalibacter sp. APA_J-10(15)]MCK0471443.1 SDR family oxidoreductase [Halalkalibacter sp. APA_J-10(15)]